MTRHDLNELADELQAALDTEREAHAETEALLERERLAMAEILLASWRVCLRDRPDDWETIVNHLIEDTDAFLSEPAPDPAADAASRLMADFDRAMDRAIKKLKDA